MITSVSNDQVKHIVSLHKIKGRKESGEYIIEGKRFVAEAFLRKASVRKIYYVNLRFEDSGFRKIMDLAEEQGIEIEEVTDPVMRKMSSTEEPQGILAVVRKQYFDWGDIEINAESLILILDRLRDPGNVGTILRTALAADVRNIIVTKGAADIYNPKVLRSSMGAIFSQTILTDTEPEDIIKFCRQQNCTLAVSSMEGSSIFKETISAYYPLAFVIGNEAYGVDKMFSEQALLKLSIPMFNNVESLNAAMAAGIFLYESRRQAQFL